MSDFTSPLATRDSISRTDLLELEHRARLAGDAELADYIARAHDQRSAWHRGLDCDTDILDWCVGELNAQQAVIDLAFERAAITTARLADTHAERAGWALSLKGAR